MNSQEIFDAPAEAVDAAPVSPVTAERIRLEGVESEARAKKADIRERIREVMRVANEIHREMGKVDGAIADVERRVSLVSAPRREYLNARSDAIARGLMGEAVDPSDLQRSTEFADALPAGDLAEGLRALKSRRDELNRRMVGSRADARKLQGDFYIAHAEEHGARYLILREQIAQSYVHLLAAQRSALNLTSMSMLVPLHFESLNLPSPDKTDDLKNLRTKPWLPSHDVDGNMLARSAHVGNATVAIKQEMGV